MIGLLLMALPMRQFAQVRDYENGFLFNVFDIENIEERIQLASALATSDIWICNPTDNPGELFIRPNSNYADIPIYAEFDYLRMMLKEEYNEASLLPKEEFATLFSSWANHISTDYYNFLISDQLDRANHCMDAEPFCTTDVYNFPALNSGYSWSGPNYGCLGSSPMSKHSFWYYMRIGAAGNITIKIEASFDVDFALWGPFGNETDPCPTAAGQSGMLTATCSNCPNNTSSTSNYPYGNLHDCSYDAAHYEFAHVVNGQVGQYFILLITNYSGGSGNITFQKYAGNGETDCGILPPLVNNDGPFCVGDAIHLSANGQAGATYSWTGPNGFTSNQQNPTINNASLSHTGAYTCTISLGNQSNNASTQVRVYPKPTASFTATSVCKGEATQFTSTSTTNPAGQSITSYLWNFGDGQTSTLQNPSHTYAESGNKTVSLTVGTGNDACTNTKTQTVTVYANPVANAGPDQTVIYGATATLNGSGGTGNFNYHWEPANLVVNPDAQSTSTVGLQQSTTFTLTVTHPQGGCTSTDQVSILVEGSNMTATANATPTSICLGDESQLQAIAVGGTNNYTYSWSPTLGLSAPNIANPKASPTTTTTYSCVVSDGMSTQTVSTTVTVNQPEYSEETHYICPGDTYTFYGQDYSEEGNYEYYTTTSQGCEKVITLHLHHYPSYGNASTTEAAICPGFSYPFHGQDFNTSGMHPVNLHTTQGCDSIVWLNLLVYPPNDTTIVDPTICTSQTYNFHGTEYNHDGDIAYFDTIDSHGCLKVEKLVLSVGPYQMPPIQNQYECYAYDDTPSYYWDKTGLTYTQDAYDEIILPDPAGGCDIKYRLNLKFHQEFYNEEERTECDRYYWPVNGQTYMTSGHYTAAFPIGGGSNFNCDSTYVLDLTVNYSDVEKVIDTTACDEYYWNFGWNHEQDTTVTEEGHHIFTRRIDTKLGCDSIVTLNLVLEKTPSFESIEGHSWVVGGSEFQYTTESYWIDVAGSHKTTWDLTYKDGSHFNKWDTVSYDNGDRFMIYIYTYELDTIYVHATTRPAINPTSGNMICDDASYTKSKMIVCTPYGSQEITQKCTVDIFPNPNNGDMTITFNNMSGEIMVKVFNMQGITVDQFQVRKGYETSSIPYHSDRLSAGIYMFSFTSKEGSLTKKVVITK